MCDDFNVIVEFDNSNYYSYILVDGIKKSLIETIPCIDLIKKNVLLEILLNKKMEMTNRFFQHIINIFWSNNSLELSSLIDVIKKYYHVKNLSISKNAFGLLLLNNSETKKIINVFLKNEVTIFNYDFNEDLDNFITFNYIINFYDEIDKKNLLYLLSLTNFYDNGKNIFFKNLIDYFNDNNIYYDKESFDVFIKDIICSKTKIL